MESRPPSEGGQYGTQAMIRLLFFALYAIQADFYPETDRHWNAAKSPRSGIISPFEGGHRGMSFSTMIYHDKIKLRAPHSQALLAIVTKSTFFQVDVLNISGGIHYTPVVSTVRKPITMPQLVECLFPRPGD